MGYRETIYEALIMKWCEHFTNMFSINILWFTRYANPQNLLLEHVIRPAKTQNVFVVAKLVQQRGFGLIQQVPEVFWQHILLKHQLVTMQQKSNCCICLHYCQTNSHCLNKKFINWTFSILPWATLIRFHAAHVASSFPRNDFLNDIHKHNTQHITSRPTGKLGGTFWSSKLVWTLFIGQGLLCVYT